MKKIKLFVIFSFLSLLTFGQSELSFNIVKAEYKANEQYLKIDLIVKNNTDSTAFFIKPKNYFFDKHYDKRNQLGFHGLNIAPYNLKITSNKKCKTNNEGYVQPMQDNDQTHLKSEMVEIKPNESKTYKNIKIERFDGNFCKKREYKIQLNYKHNVQIMDNKLVTEIKEKYDLIKKETKELNFILYYNASSYRSTEKDNFKKLNEFLKKIPKMKTLNNKEFSSNSILATEVE